MNVIRPLLPQHTRPVVTPWADDRPSEVPPNDGYVGSAPDASTAAVAQEQAVPLPLHKRVMLGALAALSLGGVIGGVVATHLPPAVTRSTPARPLTEEQARAEAHARIERMIEAGNQGRTVPADLRAKVHERLDGLPLHVVRAVSDNGVRIAIMTEGETPADVGVIKTIDMNQFRDAASLARIADGAFAEAHQAHGERIAALEQRLESAREAARERLKAHPEAAQQVGGLAGAFAAMSGDPTVLDPEVGKITGELQRARVARSSDAWERIFKDAGGRLEPYGASLGAYNPMIAMAASMMPVNLESIAQAHGAKTPEQVKQFVDMTLALNGSRVDDAQKSFVEMGRRFNPQMKPPDVPISKRPFVAGNSDVVIPSYYLLDDGSVVSGHDFDSMANWRAGATAGQYWHQPDRKTVVLHEKHLRGDDADRSVTIHEFGHAYQSALEARAPGFYEKFIPRWKQAYEANCEAIGENRFPTSYAATNQREFFAEGFSIHFGSDREAVQKRDPKGAALVREAIDAADDVVGWRLADGGRR